MNHGLAVSQREKAELLQLWRKEQINLTVRNKILDRLDHLPNIWLNNLRRSGLKFLIVLK